MVWYLRSGCSLVPLPGSDGKLDYWTLFVSQYQHTLTETILEILRVMLGIPHVDTLVSFACDEPGDGVW